MCHAYLDKTRSSFLSWTGHFRDFKILLGLTQLPYRVSERFTILVHFCYQVIFREDCSTVSHLIFQCSECFIVSRSNSHFNIFVSHISPAAISYLNMNSEHQSSTKDSSFGERRSDVRCGCWIQYIKSAQHWASTLVPHNRPLRIYVPEYAKHTCMYLYIRVTARLVSGSSLCGEKDRVGGTAAALHEDCNIADISLGSLGLSIWEHRVRETGGCQGVTAVREKGVERSYFLPADADVMVNAVLVGMMG
jgi:hypothetical protein